MAEKQAMPINASTLAIITVALPNRGISVDHFLPGTRNGMKCATMDLDFS
jgi:hypothetical protein